MYIFLTGGKTMGHISPLLSLYKRLNNQYEIIYFGLENSMEERECKRLNIKFYSLKTYPFYRKNIFKNFKTIYYILKEAKRLRKNYKKEDVKAIFSTGGFVSIPLIIAFSLNKKVKKYLLESNTTLGLANRFLLVFVNKLFIQFPTIKHKKAITVGNPIEIPKCNFDHPFFYSRKKKVLFVGGSNGALEIVKVAYDFNCLFPDVNIFVITGDKYFETYQFNDNARVFIRIDDLSSIFHKFDLIVSRAGGSTITEILLTHSASVLMPSRNVSANHQFKNAMYLKSLNAVEVIDFYEKNTANKIYEILINQKRIDEFKCNLKDRNIDNSLEKILKLLETLS